MAALIKTLRISMSVNNVAKILTNLSLSSNAPINSSGFCKIPRIATVGAFHSTAKRFDLLEFFDSPKNYGQNEVKVGRSWKKDELRLKSNEDLHKLWFVLLKERNMLFTMEEACKEAFELFPNPERIDKVQDSMKNLEEVVRERNRAYHLLETGETGERPQKVVSSQIGMRHCYRMRQHCIPKFMNAKWHETHKFGYDGYAVRKFLRRYNEKKWLEKRKALNRQRNRVKKLIGKFPNIDYEAIKHHYPDVDLEKVSKDLKIRGHFAPK